MIRNTNQQSEHRLPILGGKVQYLRTRSYAHLGSGKLCVCCSRNMYTAAGHTAGGQEWEMGSCFLGKS